MTEKRTAILLVSAALLVAVLACNMPEPTPARPTPTEAGPPEPTPTAPEASATPEQTPDTGPAPGETTEVTPSPSPTAESPLRVVYTSGGTLWMIEGEGPARQLTGGPGDSAPVFSPDGRWVLFRRELPLGPAGLSRFELRVVGVDGSGDRFLVRPEDLPGEMGTTPDSDAEVLLDRLPMQTAWLPDSQTVAFNTHIEAGYGLATNDDLWLVDLQSGTLARLLGDGEGGSFASSPDGSHLVVSSASAVAMLDADGGNRRTLVTFSFVNTASEYAYHPMPVWAPDGSHALVGISSPEPFDPDPTATFWRLPLSGDAVSLGTLSGQFLFSTSSGETWSADRTRFAHTVPVDDSATMRDLVIVKPDGSDPVVYATGDLEFLAWAPQGDDFAFWQNLRSEVHLGAVGQSPVQLFALQGEDARVASFRWAGDDTLVYVVADAGEFTIWAGPIRGEHRVIGRSAGSFPQFDVR